MTSLLSATLAVFEKDSTFWLPAARSKVAYEVEHTWDVLLYTSLFFFVIVVGSMVYFMVKYRRRSHADQVSTVTHNTPVEIIWTLVPLILVMWFFVVGFRAFVSFDTPPTDALVIEAQARQWSFQFAYPGGGKSNVLFVPKGRAVRLNMTSNDVLHAFYVPNFHISRNMVPGRVTEIWFEATQVSGDAGFPVYCTQYCGKSHSEMFTKVVVMEPVDFEKKLIELANVFKQDNKYLPYAEVGENLYKSLGCGTCHTTDGKDNTGPTWQGFWTRKHEFEGGAPAIDPVPDPSADPNDPAVKKMLAYIAESVIVPGAKIVKGKTNAMSSFASEFGDRADAKPTAAEYQDYYKYQKTLAVAEYLKKLSYGDKYDPSKAPKFQEPVETPAGAPSPSQPATK